MLSNIFKVLKNPNSFIIWFLTTAIAIVLWYIYSDIEYVWGNYGLTFAYLDAFLSWMMIILFPLMIAGIVHRSLAFWSRWLTEKKSGFLGIAWGVISAFITWCACCGVSLLSFLGLTSVISFLSIFPYDGLEIKLLAILLLLYSFSDLYRHLEVCKIKK